MVVVLVVMVNLTVVVVFLGGCDRGDGDNVSGNDGCNSSDDGRLTLVSVIW